MKIYLFICALFALMLHSLDAKPTEASCQSAYDKLGGINALGSKLIPCIGFSPGSTPSQECCKASLSLLGPTSSFNGCLCIQSTYSQLTDSISSSALARSAGITKDSIEEIMTKCQVPFYGSSKC